MTLSTIQNRVLNTLGDTIVNGVFGYTAAMIKDWVNMGIRVIVSRTPIPKCKQVYHTKPSSKFAPDDGLVLETIKLLSVTRDDSDSIARKSDEVEYEDIQETEVNSLFAPSAFKPKHIITPQSDGTVKVRVYPASSSDIAQITYVSYPEVDPAFDTIIAGFPEELEPFVDLYAVIQGKIRALGYYRKLINDEILLVNGTYVVSTTAFTAQTELNINHGNGAYPDVLIIDSSGNEIQGDVDHTTAGGVLSVNDVRIRFTFAKTGTVIISGYTTASGLTDNFISSLPTWSAISMGTMPTAPTLVSDISAYITAYPLPTAPTIVSDISAYIAAYPLPALTAALEADASGIVALLGAIPTFDGTLGSTQTDGLLVTGQKYKITTFETGDDFTNIGGLNATGSVFVATGTTPTTWTNGSRVDIVLDINVDRIIHLLNTAADIIWTEQDTTDAITEDLENFLSNHDSEMVNAAANGANSAVSTAQVELATELGKLTNWEGEYNSKVKNFIAQIDAWLGRWKTYTDEDELKLKEFMTDIDLWVKTWKAYVDEDDIAIKNYIANVERWFKVWKAYVDEDTVAISHYREQVTEIIVTYKADIENEATRFNSALNLAKVYLEAALIRLKTADNHIASVGLLPAEINLLQKQFDEGINHFIRN